MKRLTATLCLTIAVLLGSAGCDESADYQKGYTAYKSGDYATALREWSPLAEQGNARAQTFLGMLYRNGQGVPRDDKTAVKWYRLAAKQEYAAAQFNLGRMYYHGMGVPQDDKTAVKWFRLAAEEGHAFGALNLAFAYFDGKGAEENWVSGYVWALISLDSATKVVESTKNVSLLRKYQYIIDKHVPRIKVGVKKKLTAVQITVSEKLARECIRKKYKGC